MQLEPQPPKEKPSKKEVDTETQAVLQDHPEVLERVERFRKEGSKGKPLREVMAELNIEP